MNRAHAARLRQLEALLAIPTEEACPDHVVRQKLFEELPDDDDEAVVAPDHEARVRALAEAITRQAG